jgi:putative hydrolase of the HAD superfamily
MIRAVVFDFGQVISLPPDPRVMEKIAGAAGLEVNAMFRLVWDNRDEYDRGTFTGKEYYRWILSLAGITKEDAALEELARLDSCAWTNLNPATVRLMEEVKRAGYKLGILSNMPFDFLELARKTLPIFGKTDAAVFSCEARSIKPESLIYEKLIAACGCDPREIVFFDDLPVNVEKAREMGMQAFVWQDPRAARAELQKLGLALA